MSDQYDLKVLKYRYTRKQVTSTKGGEKQHMDENFTSNEMSLQSLRTTVQPTMITRLNKHIRINQITLKRAFKPNKSPITLGS